MNRVLLDRPKKSMISVARDVAAATAQTRPSNGVPVAGLGGSQ